MTGLKNSFREKGQDLVEYALLLAIIVGIGFLIYSQTRMEDSIRTVFNNAGTLMENAAGNNNSQNEDKPRSIPDIIGKSIGDGNAGLGNLLNTDSTHYIYSGTDEGKQLAQALNIPFHQGDIWSVGRETTGKNDYYVLAYYSAAESGPVSKYASPNHAWNWQVNSSGELSTATGERISVPARYYVYDPATGQQITSGYYSSHNTATLVYAPGTGKEYTIR